MNFDSRLRLAAFSYLNALQVRTGGPVKYAEAAAFQFEGARIPLMDPQRGIRKPRILDAALSFRTVHVHHPDQRPYDDLPGSDGYLRYKWRGKSRDHAENIALRTAQQDELPMIWFSGIAPGVYLPIYPVWLAAEEPEKHQFVVALDEEQLRSWKDADSGNVSKAYAERIIRDRMHQPIFRLRVLNAYGQRCAMCRLGHHELLDAAHIRSDAFGGEPIVPNGIAMCKIHHAAFDGMLLGIRPDYVVEIRKDLLREADGPTLRYTLQAMHGEAIRVPRQIAAQPDLMLLEERYQRFREAS